MDIEYVLAYLASAAFFSGIIRSNHDSKGPQDEMPWRVNIISSLLWPLSLIAAMGYGFDRALQRYK